LCSTAVVQLYHTPIDLASTGSALQYNLGPPPAKTIQRDSELKFFRSAFFCSDL
jgi:hypothetical protein